MSSNNFIKYILKHFLLQNLNISWNSFSHRIIEINLYEWYVVRNNDGYKIHNGRYLLNGPHNSYRSPSVIIIFSTRWQLARTKQCVMLIGSGGPYVTSRFPGTNIFQKHWYSNIFKGLYVFRTIFILLLCSEIVLFI